MDLLINYFKELRGFKEHYSHNLRDFKLAIILSLEFAQ
jgi:hypothetical protein